MPELYTWKCAGLEYSEIIRQEYANACVSAGLVDGHSEDTMYLRVMRHDGRDDVLVLLRPDEVAAIAWCAAGVLFSKELSEHVESQIEAVTV